jgi:A/G-specific adenine glycosylase
MQATRRTPTAAFSTRIRRWQRRQGRHDLPWQGTRDPYRIWISEIMLQQTQVATVIPYFDRFLARFPDVRTLAAAPVDEVMRMWSGLGYYARARNLHRAAQVVVDGHGGRFPLAVKALVAMPGIGRSTAAAIVAFATGEPHAILDGNVKRVLARHYGVEGAVDAAPVVAELWRLAESLMPVKGVESYTQGLMDLGATVCTRARPECTRCPLRTDCVALAQGRVAELPGRKPSRPAPRRAVGMVVAILRDEVLVQKRPPSGIWGGLWSLPEVPAGEDASAWTATLFGLRVESSDALEPFTHAFTHYTLAVTPFLVRVKGPREAVGEAGTTWLPMQEVANAALPAPVKRLLLRLRNAPGRRVKGERKR